MLNLNGNLGVQIEGRQRALGRINGMGLDGKCRLRRPPYEPQMQKKVFQPLLVIEGSLIRKRRTPHAATASKLSHDH